MYPQWLHHSKPIITQVFSPSVQDHRKHALTFHQIANFPSLKLRIQTQPTMVKGLATTTQSTEQQLF